MLGATSLVSEKLIAKTQIFSEPGPEYTKVFGKYDYTFIVGNNEFRGSFVKTAPRQWQERTNYSGIPTYYFTEVPGDEGWITLKDSSRQQFVRFRASEDGPLQLTRDPNGIWGEGNVKGVTVDIVGFEDRKPISKPTTKAAADLAISNAITPKQTPTPTPTGTLTSTALPSPIATPTPIVEHGWSDKHIATAFGITGVVIMLILAIFFPNPTPFQYTVFRIVLALVGAGVGATIPGLVDVDVGGAVRASGAIAVFVIVYFFSPAQLVASKPATPDPVNTSSPQPPPEHADEPPPR